MTSRRASILAQFKIALEAIDGTGDFNLNARSAGGFGGVHYWEKAGFSMAVLPLISLHWEEDRKNDDATDSKNSIYRSLSVIVDGWVPEVSGVSSTLQADRMAEDIERAVMLAASVDGTDILSVAYQVDLEGSNPFPSIEGQAENGASVRFVASYKNLETDPSAE